MATTVNAHFEPKTDQYGELTLQAEHPMHGALYNYLVGLAFICFVILTASGILFADQADFSNPSSHAAHDYTPAAMDYN
ncbi:MAG: hypothetical protein WBQ60_07580 [Asticcacaulis sp.]